MDARLPIGTLFRLSLASGMTSAVEFHLRRGAPINGRDATGRSPLMIAAARGHVALCRTLLEAGADCALEDDTGRTALVAARMGGHLEAAALIDAHMVSPASNEREACSRVAVEEVPAEGKDDLPSAIPELLPSAGWEAEVGGDGLGALAVVVAPFAPDLAEPVANLVGGPTHARSMTETAECGRSLPPSMPACFEAPEAPLDASAPPPSFDPSEPSEWEPEEETCLTPHDDGVNLSASSLDRALTAAKVVAAGEDWSDVAIDLSIPGSTLKGLFPEGSDAPDVLLELIDDAMRDGFVDATRIDSLAQLAQSAEVGADLARWLHGAVGEIGAVVLDDGPWSLAHHDPGSAAQGSAAPGAASAADAYRFLSDLADDSLDELALLEREARSARKLSADEEQDLFRELRSAREQVLAEVAAHGSTPDLLLEWADRLDAGALSARDVSGQAFHPVGTSAAEVHAVGMPFDEHGRELTEPAAAEDVPPRASPGEAALASLLRATARLYRNGSAPAPQPLLEAGLRALAPTTPRIVELADRAIVAQAGRLRRHRKPASHRSTGADLSVLRKEPPKARHEQADAGRIGPQRLEAALGRFEEARDRIVRGNLRRVLWLARRYARGPAMLLDLVQEGQIGLLRAIDRYDPARGFRFGTYAQWWLKQAMRRSIQDHGRTIRIPVHLLDRQARLHKISAALRIRYGRDPDPAEVAAAVDASPDAVRRVQEIMVNTLHVDEAWEAPDDPEVDAPTGLAEIAPDATALSPLDTLLHTDLRRCLQLGLHGLAPREQHVLSLRFGIEDGNPRTLEEVGQHYGVTRERIRQIESKALKRIRRKLPSREFENMNP